MFISHWCAGDGGSCPVHPTDTSRLEEAAKKLNSAMQMEAGEAAKLASQLLEAINAQPRFQDSGLVVNLAHLMAMGGRDEEARAAYTAAAVRAEAEYGSSHALPQLYRSLASKPPYTASELSKAETRRRAGGSWVESCGLSKKTLGRWMDPVRFLAPLRQMPNGQAAMSRQDLEPHIALEKAKVTVIQGAYKPGVDVWAEAPPASSSGPGPAKSE